MRGQLTELQIPTGGVRSDVAPHKLPEDAIPADPARNIIIHGGKLVNRQGYERLSEVPVQGRPMGGILFRFQVGFKTVVATTAGWYVFDTTTVPSSWLDITGGVPLTGDFDSPVRFTVWADSSQRLLLGVNGATGNAPKKWDGNTAAYSDIGGFPPPASDITTASNRVLIADTLEGGLRQVYRVRLSDFNDPNTWPPNNFVDLSDTPDQLVGIQALSRVACAVYKEETEWIAVAQSGIFPFKFERQDARPGPVSPAAVIDAQGRHYYLGRDANVYTFDGLRATPVGEPIRHWMQHNLNFDKKVRTFGFYERNDRNVWWVFPPTGSEDPLWAVSLNIDSGAFFPHELSHKMSTAFAWDSQASVTWDSLAPFTWDNIAGTYPTWDSFGSLSVPLVLMGQTSGIMERFGFSAMDDGISPRSKWRHGPLGYGGTGMRTRPQSLDTLFDRVGHVPGTQKQFVTTQIGFTDTLANEPLFPPEGVASYNLEDGAPKVTSYEQLQMGAGDATAETKYVAVEHYIDVVDDFAWNGAVLSHFPQKAP